MSRFVTVHAGTPRRLRAALITAFDEHSTDAEERAIALVHGLHGTAAMLGLQAIHELGFALERALLESRGKFDGEFGEVREAMLAAVDMLEQLLAHADSDLHGAPVAEATLRLVTLLRPR